MWIMITPQGGSEVRMGSRDLVRSLGLAERQAMAACVREGP
jgi:hypothetical protein